MPSSQADFTVRLDRVFSGPMDLLLHLVREQEVEIVDIEIHSIVKEYLAYLKALADLDIEAAGDFVVMAATLMAIKSRSLLPKEELNLEEELDPKDELILRLLEYRRFRGASEELEQRWTDRGLHHDRGWRGEIAESRVEPTLELGELTPFDLLGVWSRLQRETLANRPHTVASEGKPLRHYVHALAQRLQKAGTLSLLTAARQEVGDDVSDAEYKDSLVGSFCAILEMAKLGLVKLTQDERCADVEIEFTAEEGLDVEDLIANAQFDEVDEETQNEAEETVERILAEAQSMEDAPTESQADEAAAEGPEVATGEVAGDAGAAEAEAADGEADGVEHGGSALELPEGFEPERN